MKRKAKQKKRERSIFTRIFVPLLLVTAMQAFLLYGILLAGGVFTNLQKAELELMQERAGNSFQMLQENMASRWTNLSSTEEIIHQTAAKVLARENREWSDLERDSALCAEIAEDTVSELIYRLRSNSTTGIFLIFNDIDGGEGDRRTGIYLRTASPAQETAGNSDLQMVRGLPAAARDSGLSLSSFWQANFSFEGEPDAPQNRYFFRPLTQGQTQNLKKSQYGCYWSRPFQIDEGGSVSCITYSIPLINDDGYTYGVLGVELNVNYISSLLKTEWNGDRSEYFLVLGFSDNESTVYEPLVTAGGRYKQFFSSTTKEIPLQESSAKEFAGFYTLHSESQPRQQLHAVTEQLSIYPSNSPFSEERWVLIAAEDDTTLFAASRQFDNLVLISVGVALVLGVILALVTSNGIVYPITAVVRRLKSEDRRQRTDFPRSGVREIDSLSEAIATMTEEIIRSAQRTSRLIELSGLPVGVYELRTDPPLVYCSDGFFTLAGHDELCGAQDTLTTGQLQDLLREITADPVEQDIYRLRRKDNELRYVRVVRQAEEGSVIGSVLDVTNEVLERQRMEYERDYDPLTGIYNRRAFENQMDRLFSLSADQLKISAMVMLDLDNLKFLNDTYGHDCGDTYIQAFAQAMKVFGDSHSLIARRSGDEFYAFLYGFGDKETAFRYIKDCWEKIAQSTLNLPDGSSFRIRVSGGISWYPQDAELPSRLIHYADFAMYWVKHTQKGSLGQFDMEDYKASNYLVNGQDALNRLIDDELVHFAFQPILSARTGETVGYEMLMRSDVAELRTPDVILRMAKSQGKLHHIEYITWHKGFCDARQKRENGELKNTDMLFINSIANQTLFPSEQRRIETEYSDLLPQIVMEVTEGEDNNMEFTSNKLAFVERFGGMVAIDDFGTGYNSEMALMAIPAHVVKIDISFVHDVDKDADKQLLIRNLIHFARQRNIAVLAEGVETREEMIALLGFGVDYMQGYYFARPQDNPQAVAGKPHQALLRAIKQNRGT